MSTSKNKKIAKNSIILYIRMIIKTIVALISTRLVVKALGVEDYGLYSVAGSVVLMMNQFSSIMSSTTYRFISFELGKNKEKNVNNIFNTSLIIHIFFIFILLILAETLGIWYINNHLNVSPEKIKDAIFVFRFSVITTIIGIYNTPYQGIIYGLENFSAMAAIEILISIFRLIFVLLLLKITGNKLRIYAILMTILSSFKLIFYFSYTHKKYYSYVKWKLQKNIRKYKEMITFFGWTTLGVFAESGRSAGSPIVLNYFFGTTINAAYSLARSIQTYIKALTRSLSNATVPQIIKSFSGKDYKRNTQLSVYLCKYTFLLTLLISLPILLELNNLMKIWLGEVPKYTVIFARLVIINYLIKTLISGIEPVITATGRIKWFNIITGSVLLLGLPISFFLYKLGFPPYTILVIYIIITMVNVVVRIIILKNLINYNVKYLFDKAYIKIFFVTISIIPVFIIRSFIKQNTVLVSIISMVSSVIFYLVIVFFIGFENKEREYFRSFITKYLSKKK